MVGFTDDLLDCPGDFLLGSLGSFEFAELICFVWASVECEIRGHLWNWGIKTG